MTETSPPDDQYLFAVAYESDAERKRVEYLFDNVEGDVETLDGLVRVVSDVDQDEIYEKLVSKVPEEQISAFHLDPLEVDTEPERQSISQTVHASAESVEGFLEYMFSKRNAVLQSAARNEYEVYTKKGRADVRYTLQETETGTTVQIHIEGYSPAPSFLAEYFDTELSNYAQSQS